MPHTMRRETAEQRQVRLSRPSWVRRAAQAMTVSEGGGRASERRRTAPERKAERRQLKREAALFRQVPVSGSRTAATRRARVRASWR